MSEERSRQIYSLDTPRGRRRVQTNSGTTAWIPVSIPEFDSGSEQIVYSSGHKGPPYRSGGPFYLKRTSYRRGHVSGFVNKNGINYDGYYYLTGVPSVASIPDQTAILFGAGGTGIARANPLNPKASVGQFLGELSSLPRHVAKSFTDQNKNFKNFKPSVNPGSQYLGIQFGLLPFVNDLKKMYETYKHMDKTLRQLRRDNGNFIRRRVGVTDQETTNTFVSSGVKILPTQALVSVSDITTTSTNIVKYWFSGRFRYYIPELAAGPGWPPALLRNLYGANPDPELLWELTPWSWLADYFANIGDVIHNLSSYAAETAVMDYGYVMGHVRNETSVYQSFVAGNNTIGGAVPLHASLKSTRFNEVKSRLPAYPFGFGPTPGSLSDKQMAILGALGISRSF